MEFPRNFGAFPLTPHRVVHRQLSDDQIAEAVLKLMKYLRDYQIGTREERWEGGLRGPQYDVPELHFKASA